MKNNFLLDEAYEIFVQKVDRKAKTVEWLQTDPMSFTPGFSQVNRAQAKTGTISRFYGQGITLGFGVAFAFAGATGGGLWALSVSFFVTVGLAPCCLSDLGAGVANA